MKKLILLILILLFSGIIFVQKVVEKSQLPSKKGQFDYYEIPIKEGSSDFSGRLIVEMSSGKEIYFVVKNVHRAITKEALKSVMSESCLDIVLTSNSGQDDGDSEHVTKYHFDENTICEGSEQLDIWIKKIKENKQNKNLQMKLLGKMLHAIQDFYSHSNYLEKTIERKKLNSENVLPPVELNKKNCQNLRDRKYFTANNHNADWLSYLKGPRLIPIKHLEDARSHLYWNKDFDPEFDKDIAIKFSRSSLKKVNGKTYFKIIYKTQVEHSRSTYNELKFSIDSSKECN